MHELAEISRDMNHLAQHVYPVGVPNAFAFGPTLSTDQTQSVSYMDFE